MTRWGAVLLLCGLAGAPRVEAQSLGATLFGASGRHTEVSDAIASNGWGAGVGLELRWGRLAAAGRGTWVSFPGSDLTLPGAFDLIQVDAEARCTLLAPVAVSLGMSRRTISPDFATQETFLVHVGLRAETDVTRQMSLWAHASYLPFQRFGGGGNAGFGVETGLGISAALVGDRLRLRAEYAFQRVDRSVNQEDVPLQLTVARVGVEIRR